MWSVDMAANQVQQWEQENPDDIDEVPVEAADLDRIVVLARNRAAVSEPPHDADDADADDHVERVKPGHHELQREEDHSLTGILGFELESQRRDVMLHELAVVFVR